MSRWIWSRAHLFALIAFVVLSGGVYVLVLLTDYRLYAEKYFLLLVFFVIALITMIVFQSFRVTENAYKIASSMASEMAEDVMVYTRELTSELYRESPVPYLLLNADGTVSSTNLSSLRLFQVDQGQLDGKNIFDYIEGDDIHHVATFPQKFAEGLYVNNEEVRILRSDGSSRWVILSLFPFRDSNDELKGLLTLVDVTKQKEVDKAKSEFVSLASHQLRTPIATMKWNLELFEMKYLEVLSEDQKKYVTKMENNLVRMDALVEDFLNVSRFELGTLVPEPKDVELAGLFDGILEEQNKRITTKGLTINTEYDQSSASIFTDEHLFRMAIGNLVSNAVKYTPNGGTVTIRTLFENDKLTVVVQDTGIGIPKDDQDQIFGKVFRASNAKVQVSDGTGLGLYIVREALKVLKGEVSFVSEENVGTTFTATLPKQF